MVRKLVLAAAISSFSAGAFAQGAEPMKHANIGLASFASAVGYTVDDGYDEDTETEGFSGPSVFITGAINDHVAIRANYAMQSHEDESWDLDSFEGSVLLGTGLATNGFKAYGSVGFFNETLEVSYSGNDYEEDFSGLALGGGIGYNWSWVSLEFWLSVRDSSQYQDFLDDVYRYSNEDADDALAMTGGLGLSVRF